MATLKKRQGLGNNKWSLLSLRNPSESTFQGVQMKAERQKKTRPQSKRIDHRAAANKFPHRLGQSK